MKKKILILALTGCLSLLLSISLDVNAATPGTVPRATIDDAYLVASNWVETILKTKGIWGEANQAHVITCDELLSDGRVIGYFCPVSPQGYVIVSLYKVLAPVKVYSDTSNLDPNLDYGMADLIKFKMGFILTQIDSQVGSIQTAATSEVENILEINYASVWRELESGVITDNKTNKNENLITNYQEGDTLLPTSWHQDAPYNDLAPMGDGGRTVVGCVATAGAQIMTYWAWPPNGVSNSSYFWDGDDSCGGGTTGSTLSTSYTDNYDWAHIASRYDWDSTDSRWEDANGDELTQTWLNAVSELNYEVGVAVEMDFGRCVSLSNTFDMEAVYETHFRYANTIEKMDRDNYTAIDWFNLLKDEFNYNRPVHYRVEGHSIVADGWEEIGVDPPTRMYHMNYGWDNFRNDWYTLDALHLGGVSEEYLLRYIEPVNNLGSVLIGSYEPLITFNFRYFDLDAGGSNATFTAPQNIQFLAGIKVTGWGSTDGVSFENSSSGSLVLFTGGDQNRGIHISNSGEVKLINGGELKFGRSGR